MNDLLNNDFFADQLKLIWWKNKTKQKTKNTRAFFIIGMPLCIGEENIPQDKKKLICLFPSQLIKCIN